jgi:hypothetical protein
MRRFDVENTNKCGAEPPLWLAWNQHHANHGDDEDPDNTLRPITLLSPSITKESRALARPNYQFTSVGAVASGDAAAGNRVLTKPSMCS